LIFSHPFEEYSQVKITAPSYLVGTIGTIVMIHGNGAAYQVDIGHDCLLVHQSDIEPFPMPFRIHLKEVFLIGFDK
jgi:hypothetical protein